VFPRLVAAHHTIQFDRRALASGLRELDALLGKGPQAGTSTLLIGPAGTGKTTIAMQYASAATARGERAAVFMFDELCDLMVDRLQAIGMDLRPSLQKGTLTLQQIDPTELSPGEFVARVRHEVEERGATVLVIDSLNGYLNAMPHEEFLTAQLHELLAYLGNRGVATLLVVGQQGIVGSNMATPVEASYLADSIILFRFFELAGQVRKALSVTKKRGGGHENTIRELIIDAQGVRLGKALEEFQGVLSGIPALAMPVL
jgi:circadian clock protein KaiC